MHAHCCAPYTGIRENARDDVERTSLIQTLTLAENHHPWWNWATRAATHAATICSASSQPPKNIATGFGMPVHSYWYSDCHSLGKARCSELERPTLTTLRMPVSETDR
jgi:hypothetical protein